MNGMQHFKHFNLVEDERLVCHCTRLYTCYSAPLLCILLQVVELDPAMIEIARKHFNLMDDKQVTLYCTLLYTSDLLYATVHCHRLWSWTR